MAVTMEKEGDIEKQMAANVDGVSRSVLECTLQSRDDGLLARGECILKRLGKIWQKVLLIYLL